MKLIKCDKHHDRDAVATFRIIEYPKGSRPILFGAYVPTPNYFIDLCEECAAKVRITKDKDA